MEGAKAVLLASLVLLLIASATSAAPDETGHSPPPELNLSPDLHGLIRGEMREILRGTQAIAAALPVGDWEAIAATSQKMKDSYILEKKLTPGQLKELAALPSHFRELDAAFHARAEKLREAAERRDSESVAFHYWRLLESCVSCHASFAQRRFPALGARPAELHHH